MTSRPAPGEVFCLPLSIISPRLPAGRTPQHCQSRSTVSKLLTIKQVAEALQLSTSKVYELVSSGRLEGYRIAGSLRVGEDDLKQYLEACRIRKPQPRVRTNRVKLKHLRV